MFCLLISLVSALDYDYYELETETTTQSITYVNRMTYNYTPTTVGEKLIIVSSGITADDAGSDYLTRFTINSTTYSEINVEAEDNNHLNHYSTFGTQLIYNFTSLDSVDLSLDYHSEQSSTTTRMKDSKISVIDIDEVYSQENLSTVALTTTETNISILTFTPLVNGSYYILASGELQTGSIGTSAYANFYTPLGEQDTTIKEGKDVTSYIPFTFQRVETLVAGTEYNVTISGEEEASINANMRNVRLTVVYLNDNVEYAESNALSSTTSTTFQDKATLTFTPTIESDYLFVTTALIGQSNVVDSVNVRLLIDGTPYCESIVESKDNSDSTNYVCQENITLDATSHTIILQYRQQRGGTANIADARITAIQPTIKSIDVTLIEPTTAFDILVNDTFLLTCNVTNNGGINFNNVTLQAQYTNGSLISGAISLNDSANYNCGELNISDTCTKSWNVTANSLSDNIKLQCYGTTNPEDTSATSERIDILNTINDLAISLDKNVYSSGETSTAQLSIPITGVSYNVIWENNGTIICNNTGITPLVTEQIFFESCIMPDPMNDLENCTTTFYIANNPVINNFVYYNTSTPDQNAYTITNVLLKYDETYLGYSQSIKGTVKDYAGHLAIEECCRVQIDDAVTLAPIFTSDTVKIDGAGSCETHWVLNKDHFEAPKSYSTMIIAWQCSDEDLNSSLRRRGTTTTSFDVIEYVTEEDELIPVIDKTLFAGFDNVELSHNRTNNFGTPVETRVTMWFSNIITEADYHYSYLSNEESTVNIGESLTTHKLKIPEDLPTGAYRIEGNIFYSYQEDIKEFKFVKSESFNVTSLQDTMTINTLTIKDYFGMDVDTTTSSQDLGTLPYSAWDDTHISLTEGFGYQICGNITNNYDENIYWHLQNLVLHNPATGQSFEEFHKSNGHIWQRVLLPGSSEICWNSNIPLTIETHSDWQFEFDSYIGDEIKPFNCLGEFNLGECKFSGFSEYFYTAAIEDMIVFNKWITKPTNVSVGQPATYIVTAREEYLTMNDDCEYSSQNEIVWGSSNVTCLDKNDNTSELKIDYDVYPVAGEKFKVCYQILNYFSDEIDLEIYDIYIDDDSGETVVYFQDEETENYVPSIINDKLYLSEEPSRAAEQKGILVDGYANMCSKWITLPADIKGGNEWDIQGKVRINDDLYNLDVPVVWNWESDEFPIYGLRDDRTEYISVNTITDTSSYKIGDEVFVCANVTSLYPEQLDINVHYNYRCSATQDDYETDRHVYGEYSEIRGISASGSQNQCHKFIVPDDNYFKTQGSVYCYASTVVDIPTINERVTTSSSFFNISKHEITIALTPVSGYNLYLANKYDLNLIIENPFYYKHEEYEAHYSVELQSDNSLIYVLLDEIKFAINQSEINLTISLPLQDGGIYLGDKRNFDLGSGWIPEKRNSFLQKLQSGNQNISIIIDMHAHKSGSADHYLDEGITRFKETFTGFEYQRPGIAHNTAVMSEASGSTMAEKLYLNEDGVLEWYAYFNETVTEAPDGVYTTIPRRSWITIEGEQDQIRRCDNNYDYTLYNNASDINEIYLRHTCSYEESQALLGKEVQFYLQGIWNQFPYVFGTSTISQPVEINAIDTLYTDTYVGGDIAYVFINFTGYNQMKYDLKIYLKTEEGIIINAFTDANINVLPRIDTFNIPIGDNIIVYPLLIPVALDEVPYGGNYDLEIYLINPQTGKVDIETSTDITINSFNAIISENITSPTVDNDNPLTIDYQLNIPTKNMMFFPNKNQPFRIKYHFVNSGGQSISQFTTIDGQYAPLEAYAMLPAGTTQNLSVSLQPTNLVPGVYTIVQEIEIDPPVNGVPVWESIHKGEIGSFTVTETLVGEPTGLVDTTGAIYTIVDAYSNNFSYIEELLVNQSELLEIALADISYFDGVNSSTYYSNHVLETQSIFETQLMKLNINILDDPIEGTSYKIFYYVFDDEGTLVTEYDTQVIGNGTHDVYVSSDDIEPSQLEQEYFIWARVESLNGMGLYQSFPLEFIDDITIVQLTSNVQKEAPLYDVIVGTYYDRYGEAERITADILISNVGDAPDEDSILTYWLEGPNGEIFGETQEQFLEVPIGSTVLTRSLTLPLISDNGQWTFQALYETTAQPSIKVYDGFEVTGMSIFNKATDRLPVLAKKHLLLSWLGILIVVISLILLITTLSNRQHKEVGVKINRYKN